MSRSPTVLYGRYSFTWFGLVAAPFAIVLAVAAYVLTRTNSASMMLAAELASAFAGVPLIVLLSLFVAFAVRFRRPVLTIAATDVRRLDLELRWEEVSGIEIQRYLGRRYVALKLRNREAFLKALPAYVGIWWSGQLKRTKDCILLPAVRDLSTQRLYDLVREYWMEGVGVRQENAAAPSAAHVPFAPEQSAAMFASMAFGLFLFFRWMGLIDCIRADGVGCLLADTLAAVGVGAGMYLLALFVLRRVQRARPGFDLWQMLAVPQVVIGGADPTIVNALRGPWSLRREPYALRLQKSPWRFILFCSLTGGAALLLCFAPLFFIAYFLESGTNASKMLAVFTTFRAGLGLLAVLLLVDAALAVIAIVNLKMVDRGAMPQNGQGSAPSDGPGPD